MADYIKREAALHLVESALAWGWTLNQLHKEIERLPAEGVGLEAALTQARAELAAIRRYQIAGCAAGLRGPVPECPECGSTSCAYNHGGQCRFGLLHERKPRVTSSDGCLDYIYLDPPSDTSNGGPTNVP